MEIPFQCKIVHYSGSTFFYQYWHEARSLILACDIFILILILAFKFNYFDIFLVLCDAQLKKSWVTGKGM